MQNFNEAALKRKLLIEQVGFGNITGFIGRKVCFRTCVNVIMLLFSCVIAVFLLFEDECYGNEE